MRDHFPGKSTGLISGLLGPRLIRHSRLRVGQIGRTPLTPPRLGQPNPTKQKKPNGHNGISPAQAPLCPEKLFAIHLSCRQPVNQPLPPPAFHLRPKRWVHLDLNQEPRDYESPALTVELWTRVFHLVSLNERTQTAAISRNKA